MQYLLYIVNGLGMGNATRCHAVIQHHDPAAFAVDVITSGNGLRYFRAAGEVRNVEEFESLNYAKDSGGDLSIIRSVLALPKMVGHYVSNLRTLRARIREGRYSAIIIDSDYTVVFAKRLAGVPIIAINNADIIVAEGAKHRPLPAGVRMQYLVERLDNLYHRIVPDHVISPALARTDTAGKIVHAPPLVRTQVRRREHTGKIRHVLVMLSGSDFGMSTEFLKDVALPPDASVDVIGREGVSDDRVTYHGKVLDNADLLNRADVMVINAGFSAVSEAVVLGCPAVVIPVANHAEQFVNAAMISELGLGVQADRDNVSAQISHLIEHYPAFLARHRAFDCDARGAMIGARAIETWAAGPDFARSADDLPHAMTER